MLKTYLKTLTPYGGATGGTLRNKLDEEVI